MITCAFGVRKGWFGMAVSVEDRPAINELVASMA